MQFLILTFTCCFIATSAAFPSNSSTDEEIFDEDEIEQSSLFWKPSKDVKIFLYCSNSLKGLELNLTDIESIKNSGFNGKLQTKILIHGFLNGESDVFEKTVRTAFLTDGNYNVLAVDWSKGSKTLNYYAARHRIVSVAEVLSDFIEKLVQQHHITTLDHISMVGHSLGAHICALTGKKTPGIGSIVGLDPALPFFSFKKAQNRLNTGDAKYVEVIHTCSGFLGFDVPIGDVDFYPNAGQGCTQPGCFWDISGTCSHARSYKFYAESIVGKTPFWAAQCQSYDSIEKGQCNETGKITVLGGEPLNSQKPRGVFYLKTNRKSPFSRGKQV